MYQERGKVKRIHNDEVIIETVARTMYDLTLNTISELSYKTEIKYLRIRK